MVPNAGAIGAPAAVRPTHASATPPNPRGPAAKANASPPSRPATSASGPAADPAALNGPQDPERESADKKTSIEPARVSANREPTARRRLAFGRVAGATHATASAAPLAPSAVSAAAGPPLASTRTVPKRHPTPTNDAPVSEKVATKTSPPALPPRRRAPAVSVPASLVGAAARDAVAASLHPRAATPAETAAPDARRSANAPPSGRISTRPTNGSLATVPSGRRSLAPVGISHAASAEETTTPTPASLGAPSNAHPYAAFPPSPRCSPAKNAGRPAGATGARARRVVGGTAKCTTANSPKPEVQSAPPLSLTATPAKPTSRARRGWPALGATRHRAAIASARYSSGWGSLASKRQRAASRATGSPSPPPPPRWARRPRSVPPGAKFRPWSETSAPAPDIAKEGSAASAAEPSARYGAAGEAMDARTDRRSASGTQSARPGECRCCRGAGGREAGGAIAESREATSRSRAYRFESEKTGIVEDAVSGRYRIRSAASAPRCGGGPGVEGGGATTISNEPSARERISIIPSSTCCSRLPERRLR